MFFTIFIVFISLIILIIIHELGHFLVAKKFGVKVEEFGIFLPPRLVGKKIGETVYSINLLPFGAFVKLYGEERDIDDISSFSQKPIWQRVLIVIGGVVSFWITSAILLSIVFWLGVPTVVSDEENDKLIDPKVQVVAVSSNSPAEISGLKVGDIIYQLSKNNKQLTINKVKEVQEFTNFHRGEEVTLTIKRGQEIFTVTLTPRPNPPEGEGAMGLVLARTALKAHPWYLAPIKGIEATIKLSGGIIGGLGQIFGNLIQGKGLPAGAELMGPVGIGTMMTQFVKLGINYYLYFIAVISIYFAIFNILPIPALDGGKLIFLGIEAIRKKPISLKSEQRITSVFFTLLIILIILVTIKDIINLF